MPQKGECVKFRNFERKIKSPFMIYADFENYLVPEDKRKQNLYESYKNKYQIHASCSYGYKLYVLMKNLILWQRCSLQFYWQYD